MFANCLGKGYANCALEPWGGGSLLLLLSMLMNADDNNNNDNDDMGMVTQIRRFTSCLVGSARGLKTILSRWHGANILN